MAETIPILPSADFDATTTFWAAFGFGARGRWPDYLILRHEDLGIELHFWRDQAVDRWTNDVACYVRLDSPDEAREVHAGWAQLEVPGPARMSAPESEPSGAVEFHIIDPHGNLVRLGGFPQHESPA
ncbi:MAG TPA: VOC family protein [Intrasporangium sp.]|uniref:bleomycin resistance protein n=1 Tax=Intrasporangium sp. TaxID=1925024 RepID=UPI002B48F150|nr:VOC family protein [Intrasporangium sp.]HKX66429.1 VOC family protein [Intrasporangium sp.]